MTEKVGPQSLDSEGLDELRGKVKAKPEAAQRTLKATTVCQGAMVNHSFVRDLDAFVIDEPPNLLGTDTAPNPSEAALAALGSYISVGLMSNATARGITLYEISVELEGDIDTGAVWGTGNTGNDVSAGFTAERVKTTLKGDASDEELAGMEETAVKWSPVVTTLDDPNVVRLDVREEEWMGESSSPYGVDFVPRKGRIPNATWLDWNVLLTMCQETRGTFNVMDDKGDYKDLDEIQTSLADSGVTKDKDIILYCFKGARTSSTYIATRMLGYENVRTYFGSRNEWARDENLPKEEVAPREEQKVQ